MHKTLLFFSLVAIMSNTGCSSKDSIKPVNKNVLNIVNMSSYVSDIRVKGSTCAAPANPVSWNSTLATIAQAHAKDIAEIGKITHSGSGSMLDPARPSINVGSTFIERMKYYGYGAKAGQLVGENLARTNIKITKSEEPMPNFKRAIANLMKDRVHCESIMNPRFNEIGMAVYRKGEHYYFVMELGERAKATVKPFWIRQELCVKS